MAAYSPAFPPAVLKNLGKKIIDKNGIRTIGLRVEGPDIHRMLLNKFKRCKLRYRFPISINPSFCFMVRRINQEPILDGAMP